MVEIHNVSVLLHGSLLREPLQKNKIKKKTVWWTVESRESHYLTETKRERKMGEKLSKKISKMLVFLLTEVVPLTRDLACQQTLQQRQTS